MPGRVRIREAGSACGSAGGEWEPVWTARRAALRPLADIYRLGPAGLPDEEYLSRLAYTGFVKMPDWGHVRV
jgi:hypothetical protein